MLREFEKHIDQNFPFLRNSRLLMAISGGMDSVVLTHLCHSLKLNMALAHCNFNLRGKESDADEQFVLDLADAYDLEVFVQDFNTASYAKTHTISTQMAARELRYNWFKDLVEQLDFDLILTAHHMDDNLETVLINFSRGTGLDGLTGIPEQNDSIVRPLLSFSRNDIADYANSQSLKWREDTSNRSDKYLRNALRLHVIPKLKELNPQLLQNFEMTVSHLKDSQDVLRDSVAQIRTEVVEEKENGELHFDIAKIKELSNPKAYLFYLLKDCGFTEWNDIEDLLNAQSGKQVHSSRFRLVKDRNVLILSNLRLEDTTEIKIHSIKGSTKLKDKAILLFDEADALFGKQTDIKETQEKLTNEIYVDKDLLKFPLTVRGWREGDYFYPFGMDGKKKLSKFFKDEKLSLLEKEKVELLCSGNDVVWVIGKRADNRFKVTKDSKQILKISYKE